MKKKSPRIISFTQFVAIIIVTIAISMVIDFGRKAAANYRIWCEETRLEREIALARHEQELLLARKDYVQTDDYVEKVAREELKWARPGETVIIVRPIPHRSTLTPQPTPPPARPQARSHWQEWWALFFDSSPAEFMGIFEFLD